MAGWLRRLSCWMGVCWMGLLLSIPVQADDFLTTPEALADALATQTETIHLKDGTQEELFSAAFDLRPELGYFYGGSDGFRQGGMAEMTITYRWYGERGVRVVSSQTELIALLTEAMTLVQEELDVVLLGAADASPAWDYTAIFEQAEQRCSLARTMLKLRSWRTWENDYSNDVYVRFSMTYQQASAAETWQKKQQTEQAALSLAQSLFARSMPEARKALLAHDALIRLCSYDFADENTSDSHSAYGVFLPNRAVCEGYAEAYQLMMEIAGIPCDMITGYSDAGGGMEAHAWNRITLGNAAYHVDCTWDDPTSDSGEPLLRHQYFLCTDAKMQSDHNWDTATDSTVANGSLTFEQVREEMQRDSTVFDDFTLDYQPKCTEAARAAFVQETERLRVAGMQPLGAPQASAEQTIASTTASDAPKAPATVQTSAFSQRTAPPDSATAESNKTLIIFWSILVVAIVGVLFAKIHG